ncbi:hypothetical protein F0562_032221 [Nyssa sinensis]|uniref:Uncharacterized protein n=1 Tax=Nyssa sinensis TaxID=561372 RepID=A0A5J5AWH0_9ASTE|nr:hypothetical protein F0562_032221 [Nyssa sinensis]
MVRAPIRASALGSQGSDIPIGDGMGEQEQGVNPDEMMNGWGNNNTQREEKEPSEDFLNDEETENGDTGMQNEWREVDKEPEKPEKGFGSTSSRGDGLSCIGALDGNLTLHISPMKLDGNSYFSWSRACLLSIDAANLYDYVTGTFKEPGSIDPTLKQWCSGNSLVMSWLLNSMQAHINL